MQGQQEIKFTKNMLLIPIGFVFLLWFIYWFEIQFGYNFNKFGVLPREVEGVGGILFSHFIHSNATHLFHNSIPLLVLLTSLFYFYKEVAYKLIIYGALLLGFLTWIIGRESYHIGASGIVYLVFSFIFFSGMIRKHYRLIALSLTIIFIYGSMVWFILPTKDSISWESHLSGFIVGALFSFVYRKQGLIKEEYQFSNTEFDELFDEEGNLKKVESDKVL